MKNCFNTSHGSGLSRVVHFMLLTSHLHHEDQRGSRPRAQTRTGTQMSIVMDNGGRQRSGLENQLSLMSGLLISEDLEGRSLNVLHWSSKHRTHWPLCLLFTFREQQVLMEIFRHWFGLSGMEDRPVPLGTCGVPRVQYQ